MKTRVCLMGLGRTGKEVAKELIRQPDMELVAVFCSGGSVKQGRDVGEILGIQDIGMIVRSVETLEDFLQQHKVDVAIDFTKPEATLKNCVLLAQNRVRIVIGTTGFNALQVGKLRSVAEKYKTGIVYAPNITLGVNILMLLTNLAASILDGYDCCVVESHFKQKVDAPSGTAKKIAEEIRKGMIYRGEEGGEVPIHAIRAGGIVGVHKVVLAGEFDQLEIKHESFSRRAFAVGALRAIRQIIGRAGFYEMRDMLDLERVVESYMRRSEESGAIPQVVS